MTNGLRDALKRAGHEVEVVTMPFKFFPESEVEKYADWYANQDFGSFNGYEIDKLISLQFPAFYASHPNKALWLMHQHRSVYELYPENPSKKLERLREKIRFLDDTILPTFKEKYAMSENVAKRALKYNSLLTKPLYHPPFNEDRFYNDESLGYLFYPSRLEELKRQDLLIEAMRFVKTPIKAIIAGEGGQRGRYERMIEEFDLKDRVKLVGSVSEEEKIVLYAKSLAVVFPPYDEDYGYVTLEAMLSKKPVITCKDSGGVLEFVEDERNGFVCENDPRELAERFDYLYENEKKAKEMGMEGYEIYCNEREISWENVVYRLVGER